MPWKEICSMDERMSFLTQVNESEESFAALCRRFGISRKTGYKWVERYEECGAAGLSDRRPLASGHPAQVPESQIDELVGVRRDHPFWGPKKILVWLQEHRPEQTWPAASTIGDKLKIRGYIRPRRRRLRVPMSLDPLAAADHPNDTWCIDFKGHFALGDKTRCYPLTLTDQHTRYLLQCEGMTEPRFEPVQQHLTRAFREFGMPHRIRSDNGPPFASLGWGGCRDCPFGGSSSASHPSASSRESLSRMAGTRGCTARSSKRPPPRLATRCSSSSGSSTASAALTTTTAPTKLSARERLPRATPRRTEHFPTSSVRQPTRRP
jgi:transposase InsO family protein